MKMSTKFIFTVGIFFSSTSWGQWAVFDGANFSQNLKSTISTITTEITQTKALINQYTQIQREIQNLRSIGVVGVNARALDVQNELASLQRMRDAGINLQNNLKSSSNYVDGMNKLINASGLSAEEWLARERNLALQGNNNSVHLLKTGESTMLALEEAQKQREKVLSEVDPGEGMRGTIQKTNVLLGNLGVLQQQMLIHMKAQTDVAAEKGIREAYEPRLKEEGTNRFYQERLDKVKSETLIR